MGEAGIGYGAMRRLPRTLFNAATVLSLVLGAATLLLWRLSYPFGDEPCCVSLGRSCFVISSFEGSIGFGIITSYRPADQPSSLQIAARWNDVDSASLGARPTGRILFVPFGDEASHHRDGTLITRRRILFIPHWWFLIVLGILPIQWLRRRRTSAGWPGRCVQCGYDLRATPDRCPECGAVPNAKEARLPILRDSAGRHPRPVGLLSFRSEEGVNSICVHWRVRALRPLCSLWRGLMRWGARRLISPIRIEDRCALAA